MIVKFIRLRSTADAAHCRTSGFLHKLHPRPEAQMGNTLPKSYTALRDFGRPLDNFNRINYLQYQVCF